MGYSRPLAQDDLWELPGHRLTEPLTDQLETLYYERCQPSQRPRHLQEKLKDSTLAKPPPADPPPEAVEGMSLIPDS